MIEIECRQAGDPWHDWGLCELYQVLREIDWPAEAQVSLGEPDAAGFSFSAQLSPEKCGQILHRHLASAQRWNELHPRFQEGKKIDRCAPNIEDGRRIVGQKYDPKVSKAEWEASKCIGNPPQNARNRCQRLASLPITPKFLGELLSPDGGKKSLEEIATLAMRDGATGEVTQGANPFVAKHHSNGKVRGPSVQNAPRTESGAFLLSCLLASLSAWKPFVKDPRGDCTVFLPDNVPFDRAEHLWRWLRTGALVHPDEPQGEMYRNLPLRADGEEAQMLVLLHALQDRLTLREMDISGKELQSFNDWVAIHFSSSTNVSVGSIHRIEVPGGVFPLLKPIAQPAHWKRDTQVLVAFVPDCLSQIRVENASVQNDLARALLQRDPAIAWRDIERAAFLLYKNATNAKMTNRGAARLLPHFFAHFAREFSLMTEDQLTACRKIGELAGNVFSRDVTLLSRLHNCSAPDDLRSNLNLFAFRLMKASTGDESRGMWHVSPEQFSIVLDMAASPQWQAAAQTISLFACLSAFNKNLGESAKGDSKA